MDIVCINMKFAVLRHSLLTGYWFSRCRDQWLSMSWKTDRVKTCKNTHLNYRARAGRCELHMLWMFSDVIDSLVAVATSFTSQPLVQKAPGEQTYIIYAYKHTYSYIPSPPSVNHISFSRLLTRLLLLPPLSLDFALHLSFRCTPPMSSFHCLPLFSSASFFPFLSFSHPSRSSSSSSIVLFSLWFFPLSILPTASFFHSSLFSFIISHLIPLIPSSFSIFPLCSLLILNFASFSCLSNVWNHHHWEKLSSQ